MSNPPAMTCYEGNAAGTVWLEVALSPTSNAATCGLVLSNGVFHATMINAVPGWTAVFVVVY